MIGAIELPRLDRSRCTLCGDCVAICPTDCLEMTPGWPWLPRPADCISCSACELLCEPRAIRLVSMESPVEPAPLPTT